MQYLYHTPRWHKGAAQRPTQHKAKPSTTPAPSTREQPRGQHSTRQSQAPHQPRDHTTAHRRKPQRTSASDTPTSPPHEPRNHKPASPNRQSRWSEPPPAEKQARPIQTPSPETQHGRMPAHIKTHAAVAPWARPPTRDQWPSINIMRCFN